MRTVTLGLAVSLDQFIARENHSVDWLHWSKDVAAISAEYWKTIDTVLMGRKTFQMGGTAYPGVTNIVFSRTLQAAAGVTLVDSPPARYVRALKAREGKGIAVIGGGMLAKSLFDGNLIDELALNIHPVLLGRGIPLFHRLKRQLDLELLDHRLLQHQCVLLRYRVKP
jgi:dihydrofolate reductase